jgi:hypothetical protein
MEDLVRKYFLGKGWCEKGTWRGGLHSLKLHKSVTLIMARLWGVSGVQIMGEAEEESRSLSSRSLCNGRSYISDWDPVLQMKRVTKEF